MSEKKKFITLCQRKGFGTQLCDISPAKTFVHGVMVLYCNFFYNKELHTLEKRLDVWYT